MIAIDMEMPKSCALCERFEGACKYTDFGDYQTERNPNCPLVEIEERKVGKWIFHEKSISTAFKELRECSCCHCYFRWEMPRNSYCPNCGSKMSDIPTSSD